MNRRTIGAWLRALCDPTGIRGLPGGLLDAAQIATVLARAKSHGVEGTVLHHLRRALRSDDGSALFGDRHTTMGAIEPAIAEAVQAWLDKVGFVLGLRAEGERVVTRLRKAGVTVMVIKGADFADRLYPEPTLRSFRDIDLLVPRSEFARAERIVAALGYQRECEQVKHPEGYGQSGWRSTAPQRWSVEVHWNLINSPSQRRHCSIVAEELQNEQTDGPLLRASPAAMLLIAAVHAAHGHRFDRLQHLCDLRQIVREAAGPIDTDWLRAAAVRCGAVTSLNAALDVTARVLGSEASRNLRERLKLGGARLAWRLLVSSGSLVYPECATSRLRRLAVRELLKRSA